MEPQITIGFLTGYAGFPLTVHAFEGNMAGTKTMLPVIEAFMTARQLPDVTTVADAGMISQANQKAIEAVGLSFIPGMRLARPLRRRQPLDRRRNRVVHQEVRPDCPPLPHHRDPGRKPRHHSR